MDILVDKNFRVRTQDSRNIVVSEIRPATKGNKEQVEEVLGYFATAQQAFEFLLHTKINKSSAKSIKELNAEITKLMNELDRLLPLGRK